ncbi:MAG: DJ-1/PfpI family protein [Xanthomonadales bacterium]|nr:DJ-1/PfpI family protein [Xanthomonadales bacterium]
MTLNVAIYLYPGVEVLDFAGPFEVFTTASRMQARRIPDAAPPFAVFTVARSKAPVRARAGLVVLPEHDFADAPRIDLLLIPGGVVDTELADPALAAWIAQTAKQARITASVCTGSFLLAGAGLLAGRRATTHWEDLADLRQRFPAVEVVEQQRWVDEGPIVSSAGIAAGIDMSLHLCARLTSLELARITARQMDVPYPGD